MTALGAVFRPQLPPERLRDVASAADDAGLDELWLWEDCFLEGGIATTAAALAWTRRLRVGIGILPVPLRNVALTSMEAAALDRMFPGRVTVAVGHGLQSWMEQVGARVESPLTLLREYLAATRALLRGERVSVDGRYVKLDDVALDWPPSAPPAVFSGGIGPRTLRLTGEAADGTIVVAGIPPERIREARRLVDEGRAEAGRSGPHPIVAYFHAATGPGASARIDAELERENHTSPKAEISVAGDAQAFAEAVQRLTEAGADSVIFQPTADEPDLEGFVRFIAEEVRPLVK
ncbi:LLM class flavin-dependent oxidoreductase [Spongiactinospora sp. TRM90649]|uniref:LLM class flavin-dependent oxidoreductase n=1 Tax=Spongiactinospora sp. TRM90649 TaxID=3031114 RepID=UPI0023F670B9|nr:LLM class flavin-dependent oxidoreductase [Spongiactinospora sp. TRM90649]MDF5752581.1 LLM class flavin-dependent oxidoreductase [Spongiactinospora sp. TRM90649]